MPFRRSIKRIALRCDAVTLLSLFFGFRVRNIYDETARRIAERGVDVVPLWEGGAENRDATRETAVQLLNISYLCVCRVRSTCRIRMRAPACGEKFASVCVFVRACVVCACLSRASGTGGISRPRMPHEFCMRY